MKLKQRNVRLFAFAMGIFAIFSLSSCIEDLFNTNKQEDGYALFDYATTSKKNLDVTIKSMKNELVSGVVVEVYFNYPYNETGQKFDSVSPVAKLLTDDLGNANTVIDIPGYLTDFYLVTNYPGYANPDTIAVTSSDIILIIHPAGYSDNSLNRVSSTPSLRSSSAESEPYEMGNFKDVWSLSTFNKAGVPDFLETSDDISNDLKAKINAALPDGVSILKANPQYLEDASKANIKIIKSCELFVTFVTECAAYSNTLGYFYYPTKSEPASVSEIKKRIVVFPNASLAGAGGELIEGNKVRLKYYDEASGKWSNIFPPDITVSWFLISDGFRDGNVTDGNYWIYALPKFNNEELQPQQNLILYDKAEEKMIIAFEDQMRTPSYSSDDDFNDEVFYASSIPVGAIDTEDLIIVDDPTDVDGDGVTDTEDEYQTDPERCFKNYYPGKDQWGTLAFEDLWPNQGDYDLNDFVTNYNFTTVSNAQNKVVDIFANFKVRAAGARLHNAFVFQLETTPLNVLSVTGSLNLSGRLILNANGTEAIQSKAVIPVVDDVITLFGKDMVNTVIGGATATEQTISLTIHLRTPTSINTLGIPPYNPFLIASVDIERGKEIHLAGMVPTDLVNTSYFGKGEDRTDVAAGRYYVANQNFPWALKFPVTFDYPVEERRINSAYLKFDEWVKTLGVSFPDWYIDNIGYRNNDNIYRR